MIKRVILIGEGASGKDFLRKYLSKNGYEYQISYTTRTSRPIEKHGVDYYFLSHSEFKEMLNANEFYSYMEFGGDLYGTTNKQFNTLNGLFIMSPIIIDAIYKKGDIGSCFIIYLNTDVDIRKQRFIRRGCSKQKIRKRLRNDNKLFKNVKHYDLKITDSYFDKYKILKAIRESIVNLLFNRVVKSHSKHIKNG